MGIMAQLQINLRTKYDWLKPEQANFPLELDQVKPKWTLRRNFQFRDTFSLRSLRWLLSFH